MFKYILITLLSFSCLAVCIDYPAYCQIKKNHPSIDEKVAWNLTMAIRSAQSVYGVDGKVMAGIFMQESSYRISATNHSSKDYGLGQVNIKTAATYELDVDKLRSSMSYSVNATARILRDLKRRYPKEMDYWTRYHSFTPSRRDKYKKLVEKYL